MMPITPSGTRTRWIRKPFGRSHSASTVPTGSASRAISSTPRAMASTRTASRRQAIDHCSREPAGPGHLEILRVGGEDLVPTPAQSLRRSFERGVLLRRVARASTSAAATAARPMGASSLSMSSMIK